MSKGQLKDTLFEEKSLGALLRTYEEVFATPLPSKALGAWFGLLTFLLLLFLWYFKGVDATQLQKASGLMALYALTVSSALMGVVIAGMSIFAASLKPKVANGLIETPYPGTEISSLKFIFAMFAYILFSLFVMIATCGVYYIGLADSALVLQISRGIVGEGHGEGVLTFLHVLYASVLLGLIFFLGSLLKSFIWNLHQVLLVVAVFNGKVDEG
jgi:ABC-type transport system involved in multi-copper enzyme maturation permease subunit